jgi:hypothetical protein
VNSFQFLIVLGRVSERRGRRRLVLDANATSLTTGEREAVAKTAPNQWVFPIAQRRLAAPVIVAWRAGSLEFCADGEA